MKTITKIKRWIMYRGKTFPKVFVWIYASIFLACGLLGVFGVLTELLAKGSINYKALIEFIKEYFAPGVVASFGIVGALLIDRDSDGIPDKWEEDKNDKL